MNLNRKTPIPKETADRPRGTKRRIIGIDPGLASSGWGILDYAAGNIRYLAHGCIETKADTLRERRLLFIRRQIVSLLEQWNPSEAAMETLYFGKNVSSALAVAEARGVISATLAEAELPIRELTPGQLKQGVVGLSRADKGQVQEMVRLILGLPGIPRPDHAADALAAAICAAHGAPA